MTAERALRIIRSHRVGELCVAARDRVVGLGVHANGGVRMLRLVRHGESESNAGAITFDTESIALTARGREQANAVAQACTVAPAWFGLSRYKRARQTAEPTLARYPHAAIHELDVHEFTYLDLSPYPQGTDPAFRRPLADAYWQRMDPEHTDGGDAESFAGLCRRTALFLAWAAAQPGDGIVFTHEQFIRAAIVDALYGGVPPSVETMRRFFSLREGMPIPNGAIVRLKYEDARWWVGGVDVAHLT